MKGERGAVHKMKEEFVTSVLVYGFLSAFEYEVVKSMKEPIRVWGVFEWLVLFLFSHTYTHMFLFADWT